MTQHEAPTGSQILDEKIAKRRAQKAAKPGAAKGSQILMDLKSGTPSVQAPSPRSASVLTAQHTASTTAVAVAATRGIPRAISRRGGTANIVGGLIKFAKNGQFITADDDQPVPAGAEFIALADQTFVGWLKFTATARLLAVRWACCTRISSCPHARALGTWTNEWELGLDNAPQDPWQHFVCLVLQDARAQKSYSPTRQAQEDRTARLRQFAATLYDRMHRTNPDELPRVRLGKAGSSTGTRKSAGSPCRTVHRHRTHTARRCC